METRYPLNSPNPIPLRLVHLKTHIPVGLIIYVNATDREGVVSVFLLASLPWSALRKQSLVNEFEWEAIGGKLCVAAVVYKTFH